MHDLGVSGASGAELPHNIACAMIMSTQANVRWHLSNADMGADTSLR